MTRGELIHIISESIKQQVLNEGDSKFSINNAQGYLDKGYSPEEVFYYIGKFTEGYSPVMLDDKWNFISTNSVLLSPDQWFDEVTKFENGFAIVKLNDKWNFIDTKGRILSPGQWFDSVGSFIDGFSLIELNGEWHFVDKNGKLYDKSPFDNKPLNEKAMNTLKSIIKETIKMELKTLTKK